MSRVEVEPEAQAQLGRLIATRNLPADTPARVARSIRYLATHPRLGKALRGTHAEYRCLRGPWRWLVVVYRFDPANDVVIVVAIQDSRTNDAWASDR